MDVIRAFDDFVDDVSNWYIRRSRRRFWDGDAAALQALWTALVQGIRVVAPVMPFLSEHLWQNLVRGAAGDPPASVHLAGWPEAGDAGRRRSWPRSPRFGASSRSAIRHARPRS